MLDASPIVLLVDEAVGAERQAPQAVPGQILQLLLDERHDPLSYFVGRQDLVEIVGRQCLELLPKLGILYDPARDRQRDVAISTDDAAFFDLLLDDLLVDELIRNGPGQPIDYAVVLSRYQALPEDRPPLPRVEEHRDGQPVRDEPDQTAHGDDAKKSLETE